MKRWLESTKRSLSAVIRFLYFHPGYTLFAVVISIVFYELIFWSLNLGLGWFLFTSDQLSVVDKLDLVVGSYTDVFRLPLAPLGVSILIISLLQGIVVSALVYMIRYNVSANSSSKKLFGGVGAAGGLSVLGLGCVACGTSLIAPLLAVFVSGSATALAESVGRVAVVVALLLSVYAVYLVGQRMADVKQP